jgi:hypothetical protein
MPRLPSPTAAMTIWMGGKVATGLVLFGAPFPVRDWTARWALRVAVLGIWGAVALVGIFALSMVSGNDPTTMPIARWSARSRVPLRRGSRAWRPPDWPGRSGVLEFDYALDQAGDESGRLDPRTRRVVRRSQ